MIDQIVKQWDARKDVLRAWLCENHPDTYEELIDSLTRDVLTEPIGDGWRAIDPERTTVIDHGSYSGTQIFVLCQSGYQPDEDNYLWFDNGYGSCSGCDTLQSISEYSDDPPTPDQVEAYMTLALHMVQRIKWLVQAEPTDG